MYSFYYYCFSHRFFGKKFLMRHEHNLDKVSKESVVYRSVYEGPIVWTLYLYEGPLGAADPRDRLA